jgi:hypothetical protein
MRAGLAAREGRVALFTRVVAVGMVAALAFVFFSSHYLRKGFPHNTFLVGRDNLFMDFFNVNRDTYDLNPYPTKIPYPPFALLVARGFASGFDYSINSPFGARRAAVGRLSYAVLAGGFCLVFFAAVRRVRVGDRAGDLRLLLALGLSYPFLFVIDRGNYAMLAFAFLLGFIRFYERNRRLANLLLALAISTKVYPLLFLLLLAADRRWRDAAAVVGWAAAVNLGALLFFQGSVWTNLLLFVRNVLIYAPARPVFNLISDSAWNLSFANLIRVPYVVFFQRSPRHLPLYYPVFELAVLGAVYFTLRREKAFWKKVLLVTIAQMGIPSLSQDYNLIYLVIPLLLYFQEAGEWRREDAFYLVALGLLFVPKHYYVIGVYSLDVLTVQAFVNPLLLLVVFLKLVASRPAAVAGRVAVAATDLPAGRFLAGVSGRSALTARHLGPDVDKGTGGGRPLSASGAAGA